MTFVKNLIHDVQGGRDSWRVLVTASTISLLASVALTLSSHPL